MSTCLLIPMAPQTLAQAVSLSMICVFLCASGHWVTEDQLAENDHLFNFHFKRLRHRGEARKSMEGRLQTGLGCTPLD